MTTNKVQVTLIKYGTNEKIKDIFMEGHIPAEGEFFIDDTEARDDWKDKLYIVRAVTHFHDNFVAIHIEKYDTEEQDKKWKEAVKYWEEMKERWKLDGSEKSKTDN
jgi:hypothetical protein